MRTIKPDIKLDIPSKLWLSIYFSIYLHPIQPISIPIPLKEKIKPVSNSFIFKF